MAKLALQYFWVTENYKVCFWQPYAVLNRVFKVSLNQVYVVKARSVD